jgi:hypothetical protein
VDQTIAGPFKVKGVCSVLTNVALGNAELKLTELVGIKGMNQPTCA